MGPRAMGSELPEAAGGVTVGLGQGQGENPGWSLLLGVPLVQVFE